MNSPTFPALQLYNTSVSATSVLMGGADVVSFLDHSLGMQLLPFGSTDGWGSASDVDVRVGRIQLYLMVEYIHVHTQPPPLYRREAGPYP